MSHDPFERLSRLAELAGDFRPRRKRRRKRPLRDRAAATAPAPPKPPKPPKPTRAELALANANNRLAELEEQAYYRALSTRAKTPPPSESEYKYMIRPLTASADVFATGALEALVAAMGGPPPQSQPGRDLANASIADLCGESLRLRGRSMPGGLPEDTVAAAMAESPNSPGSFPNLLSAATGMVIDSADQYAAPSYANWARKLPSVPDFKPSSIWKATGTREMPMHVDGQPYEQTTFAEQIGHIAVDEYGDEFTLTPRMVVDDALGGFAEAVRAKVEAHAATLNRLCVELLTNNAVASDGIAMFDASRSNIASPGGVPSESELSAVRLLLRQQTDPNGRVLGYSLARVLCPSELETTVEKVLADLQVVPASTSDAEPFRRRIGFDVEPILSETSAARWFAFASGGQGAVVFTHQRGYEKMQVRQYRDNATQSLVFQFSGRFAAAVLSPGSAIRNDGG